MAATKAWLLVALLVPSIATASVAHIREPALHGFKAGKSARTVHIAELTVRDLVHASRANNIDRLLELAHADGRIDELSSLAVRGRFNAIPSGDHLLLTCLQISTCQPRALSDIARASDLHAQVLLRRPGLNLTQVNHAVGDISEKVMYAHFESSGWTRIEGQVGRTGIDGLFIKRKDGVVRDVLLVESKYNTGALQLTNHGHQMSRHWVLRKLEELRRKHPNEPMYRQIDDLVAKGYYRARLWTMRVGNDEIRIDLQRVHSKSDAIEILEDPGNRIVAPPNVIRITGPSNDFERTLVRAYNDALDTVGPPPN